MINTAEAKIRTRAKSRAAVINCEVRCLEDRKLLARLTDEGVILWCRAGCHEVLLPREVLTEYFKSL